MKKDDDYINVVTAHPKMNVFHPDHPMNGSNANDNDEDLYKSENEEIRSANSLIRRKKLIDAYYQRYKDRDEYACKAKLLVNATVPGRPNQPLMNNTDKEILEILNSFNATGVYLYIYICI